MIDEILAIEKLGKSFGSKEVLKNINLKIIRGEIFALIGPSGAGKTTLLRIMNYLDAPSSGRLTFYGNEYTGGRKEHIMSRMSLLFQKPAIFNSSVFNNVAYGLTVRRVEKQTIRKKVREVLSLVGLAGMEKQNALILSGGEAQRMAFARAIVYEPDIILLDEPTSNLDPANAAKIEDLIKQIQSRLGTTIILATHNIHQVRRLAKRVGILIDGELIEINSTEQIFTQPEDARSRAFINGDYIF